MNDPKTQIVEKIKSATNILVTVSANPSVDQLSACLALTMMLNNHKKNATAVFSGKVPSVLNFLNPKDTLQKTTDSLRDFIISLDKSKADKLRYKVEDDVVKIFITPYRNSITSKDLKYSAGDFNVDLILALGVQHQQDLDAAITAHGRIFHDAVVMSINNMPKGDFGVANWVDLEASSLSELIANLTGDLDPKLLDAHIATALLTGIVAETSRFSNSKTHSRTMAVSAKLLEAGADQQLVNTQLQDLIGTIVTLEAGTEIVPDRNRVDAPVIHTDFEDELKIEDLSGLDLSGDDKKPAVVADKPVAPTTPIDVQPPAGPSEPLHDLELPNLAGGSQPATAAPTSIESLLGTPIESTPSPVLDDLKLDELPVASGPTNVATDADSARQAVEAALVSEAPAPVRPAPASSPSIIAPTFSPAAPAPETSIIRPVASGQPSYANPDTVTQYQMPAVPEHEPAPLSASPADQPFTMPMPPANTQSAPVAVVQPPTDGGTPPPPLPPPMPR